MIKERLTFFKETLRDFKATGAVLPSSAFVARKITRKALEAKNGSPLRILEVGPGTGIFSKRLAEGLAAEDVLDLCEINPNFAERLRTRFAGETSKNGPTIQVIEDSILNLTPEMPYDCIVSGLPFNSFGPDFVKSVLDKFSAILKPNGHLSFFEYLYIRELTYPFGSREYKQRVQGVAKIVTTYTEQSNAQRETVFLNFPPAVIHHVIRTNGNGSH